MLSVYEVSNGRCLIPIDPAELPPTWPTDEVVRWVRMASPAPQDLRAILGEVELPDEFVEVGQAEDVRTLVNVRGKLLFVSLPILLDDGRRLSCLRLICSASTLITIQQEANPGLDMLATELQEDEDRMQGGLATIILEIFEAALENVSPAYFALRREVDRLASALETMPSDVSMDAILELRRRASRLSMLLEDHLYCHAELQRRRLQTPWLASMREQLHEHVAGVERGSTLLARIEDRLSSLRQHYLDRLQEVTSHRLNVLAVLSAIYLPPTLVAGIYGMNFEDIPITHIPHGYFIVMSVMAAVVLGQFWYFYRRGWFK